MIFPLTQHDAVTKLHTDADAPWQRDLVQLSAGSGKANSIAWHVDARYSLGSRVATAASARTVTQQRPAAGSRQADTREQPKPSATP